MATGTWCAAVPLWKRILNRPETGTTEREFCLWIDETPRPGWANMAIDQTLLERAECFSERWLRLYQWSPSCLSFGRHEPASRRYDAGRIAELGLDTVRRPTGGRAVWHSKELTYAVAAPGTDFGSLRAAYQEIHTMLAAALSSLGASVHLAPETRTPSLDAGACFARPVGGEVMLDGRKVVGSAQLRLGSAVLQHGSILLHDDQDVVNRVTSGVSQPRAPAGGEPWAHCADVADAVVAAARDRWPGAWHRLLDDGEMVCSASIHFPRYRSAAWTWAR
jgi:lipoyl(octanoyl) transferase